MKRLMHRRFTFTGAACAALLALGAGGALAITIVPPPPSRIIFLKLVCAKRKTGVLYLTRFCKRPVNFRGPTGPTGPAGPAGPTGPQGPAPAALWANLDANGAFTAEGATTQSQQAYAQHASTGYYIITYGQNVNNCAIQATWANADAVGDTGMTATWVPPNIPYQVWVFTYDKTGSRVDHAVDVTVSC
jgi:hypothetical protein